MIKYRCYKINDILKALGDRFYLINKDVRTSISWDGSKNYENYSYFTSLKNIKRIKEGKSLGWCTTVEIENSETVYLYESQVIIDGKEPHYIYKNYFFSPKVKQHGEYVNATELFDTWLEYNGLSKEYLREITVEVEMYGKYYFKDIHEPIIIDGIESGTTYREPMRIPEDKLWAAISNIKDLEVQKKFIHIINEFGELKYE